MDKDNESEIDSLPTRSGDAGSLVLRDVAVTLGSSLAQEFVEDCAREVEGNDTAAAIKVKFGLTDAYWAALKHNHAFLDAVRNELHRRLLVGEGAREAAAREFASAPAVLGHILKDEMVAPRARIEAARELRQAADCGSARDAGSGEKFLISINIGDGKPINLEVEPAPFPRADEEENQQG